MCQLRCPFIPCPGIVPAALGRGNDLECLAVDGVSNPPLRLHREGAGISSDYKRQIGYRTGRKAPDEHLMVVPDRRVMGRLARQHGRRLRAQRLGGTPIGQRIDMMELPNEGVRFGQACH